MPHERPIYIQQAMQRDDNSFKKTPEYYIVTYSYYLKVKVTTRDPTKTLLPYCLRINLYELQYLLLYANS